MTSRATPLALASLAAWSILLGVLTSRPELFIAAVPLLLPVLLSAGASHRPPRWSLTHAVSTERLFEGERAVVTLRLTAHTPLAQIEVLEVLPPFVELLSGNPRAVFSLAAGQRVCWQYEIRCPQRGRITFGMLHLRLFDIWGLRESETDHLEPHTISVYPRGLPLRRLPRPRHTQTSFGNYVAHQFGEGLEPGDIRPFAPGDRIRRVHWRASLRRDQLFVTEFHQERNADVVLLLDTFAESGAHPASTLDFAVRAAGQLGAGYLARKDRVGLIECGGFLLSIKPGSGRAHYERLLEALLPADMTFSYIERDIKRLPTRVLPSNALVIALSPLLDQRFTGVLGDLAARGFDIVVIAVSPIGPTRRALAPSRLTDLACQLWALERRVQLDELRRRGLTVHDWDTAEPLELVISRAASMRRPIRLPAI